MKISKENKKILAICKECKKSIYYGDWYHKVGNNTFYHDECISYEEVVKMNKQNENNNKEPKKSFGTHFGQDIDEYCLEI